VPRRYWRGVRGLRCAPHGQNAAGVVASRRKTYGKTANVRRQIVHTARCFADFRVGFVTHVRFSPQFCGEIRLSLGPYARVCVRATQSEVPSVPACSRGVFPIHAKLIGTLVHHLTVGRVGIRSCAWREFPYGFKE